MSLAIALNLALPRLTNNWLKKMILLPVIDAKRALEHRAVLMSMLLQHPHAAVPLAPPWRLSSAVPAGTPLQAAVAGDGLPARLLVLLLHSDGRGALMTESGAWFHGGTSWVVDERAREGERFAGGALVALASRAPADPPFGGRLHLVDLLAWDGAGMVDAAPLETRQELLAVLAPCLTNKQWKVTPARRLDAPHQAAAVLLQ